MAPKKRAAEFEPAIFSLARKRTTWLCYTRVCKMGCSTVLQVARFQHGPAIFPWPGGSSGYGPAPNRVVAALNGTGERFIVPAPGLFAVEWSWVTSMRIVVFEPTRLSSAGLSDRCVLPIPPYARVPWRGAHPRLGLRGISRVHEPLAVFCYARPAQRPGLFHSSRLGSAL